MNQGIILYLLVALVTHFSIVAGMAVLLTVGHSVYAAVRKGNSHATTTVFRRQITFVFIFIALSMLVGSLPLWVSERAADLSYRSALLIDIVGPLLVFLHTLFRLTAASRK